MRPGFWVEAVGEVFHEEAFGAAGDEDEGEVRVLCCEMGELGEEMRAYSADTWKSLALILGGLGIGDWGLCGLGFGMLWNGRRLQ